jgi:hypothetical protein
MKARKAAKRLRQRENPNRPLAVPQNASKQRSAEPTPERIRHGVETHVYLGKRAAHSFNLVERLEASRKLDEAQRKAAERYAEHWAGAGMAGHCPAIDMDRVGGGEGASFMPSTEYAAICRVEYRKAVRALGQADSAVVERLVCHDATLTSVGMALGYALPVTAIAAATAVLQSALRRLVVHYDL